MGYRNVMAAYVIWAPVLEPHAFQALTYMALVARDDPHASTPARTYWGGHVPLAYALGLADWEHPPTPGKLRVVRRVVADLVDAGALTRKAAARPGQHAVYALELDTLGHPPSPLFDPGM